MAKKRRYSKIKDTLLHSSQDWVNSRPAYVSMRISKWNIKSRISSLSNRFFTRVERRPFVTFFTVVAILFVLIFLGNILRRPKAEKIPSPPVKSVEIYNIGASPLVHVQAQIEKTGIVKIQALAPGIVSKINVSEGQQVKQGAVLVNMSTNYSGGNAPSLQRQLASAQYQNVKDTYDTQKDIIQKQRDLADQNKTNSDKLRDITNQSISDTQGLINVNNDILSTLNSNLSGQTGNTALATKEQISQFLSANNQLNASLRQSQYQVDPSQPPQQTPQTQHDLTMEQLNIQQKALDLSLQTSRIQLNLAQVNEATMFPSAPFAGVIERIYVTAGQNVTPGTPLLELHGAQDLKVVAKVPADIAQNVSTLEDSTIHLPHGEIVTASPSYISTESTDGTLYSVIYTLDPMYQNEVSDRGYIAVDIPVGNSNPTSVEPFVPLDSVYQSESNAYVFVNDRGTAKSRTITLGPVYGQYVSVESGLSQGDEVIVSRTVLNGDKVKAE